MIAIATLAILIVVASAAAMWWLRGVYAARRAGVGPAISAELRSELRRAIRLATRTPVERSDRPSWSPALAAGAHPACADVEAALKRQQLDGALTIAEAAVTAAPHDPQANLLLAWVTVVAGHANAAGASMYKLRARTDLGPLGDFVAARARYLIFEQRAGATEAVPPLITAGDIAVVTLARAQASPTWMVGGEQELGLDAQQARAAINEHRLETVACLRLALQAFTAQPDFVDAGYWVARLAIKAGLVDEGKQLFTALAPRMVGRPDAVAFARDCAALQDPTAAFAAATAPPPAPPPEPPPLERGKRSKSLRVL